MRDPGTAFLYYWKTTAYNEAYVSTIFISQDDKTNYLGFCPLVQNTENTACKGHLSTQLETDYFAIGLRALSHKTFLRKNIAQPTGIGIYLGIIDAVQNVELSEEDEKESIQKKLFNDAENWKVGLELGSMQLSALESAQLTIFCDILAEKIVALPSIEALIAEIKCLGTPTECIQINNLNADKMEKAFQEIQQYQQDKKLLWCKKTNETQHNCASIIFKLYQAGGFSSHLKNYTRPITSVFQKVVYHVFTPNSLWAMAKHVATAEQLPEKQGCACSIM